MPMSQSPSLPQPLPADDSFLNRYPWLAPVWAILAAFGCYFCMYAFRKPFTAASFANQSLFEIDFKVVLVTAQVMGYTISKFWGIKLIAELAPERRATMIVWLIGLAMIALVLFGWLPAPWNVVALFLNGLPLGMVFGLVLGFLEGRRLTEALTAGLCASFILADGVTKSVGRWLLAIEVPETWMPAAAGGIFLLPALLFTWMLTKIPPPNADDIAARAVRVPMNREERWTFLRKYGWGIFWLIVVYLLVTILRSIRADFQPEIWQSLDNKTPATTFAQTEMWVAAGVLLINGSGVLIGNNRLAFFVSLGTCAGGFLLLTAALLGLQYQQLSGFWFMVLLGLGLYLPYVAFHTTVLERMLAMTRERGNIGFLMYLVDATGYLGYVGVMIIKNLVTGKQSTSAGHNMLDWLVQFSWLTVVVSMVCLVCSWIYFRGVKTASERTPEIAPLK